MVKQSSTSISTTVFYSFYRPHPRVTVDVGTESMTKQSFKDECDIHKILKQYQRTGIITHIKSSGARFDDLPSDVDFQSALNTVMEAENAFALLPSSVRASFNNSPAALLAALEDPKRHAELRELGILQPLPAPGSPNGPPGQPPMAPAPVPGAASEPVKGS